MAQSKKSRPTNRRWLELRVNLAVRRSGHGQQIVHGDSAGGPLLVRLVGGGSVAVAQLGESGSHLSIVHRCQCLIDLDAKTASGDSHRSPVGADLDGAPGDG